MVFWIEWAPIVWTPIGIRFIEPRAMGILVAAIVEECTATARRDASLDRAAGGGRNRESLGGPSKVDLLVFFIGVIARMDESPIVEWFRERRRIHSDSGAAQDMSASWKYERPRFPKPAWSLNRFRERTERIVPLTVVYVGVLIAGQEMLMGGSIAELAAVALIVTHSLISRAGVLIAGHEMLMGGSTAE